MKAPAKKTAAKKAKASSGSKAKAASKNIPRLRIRMYRHGLGDCLLLRFALPDQVGTFNVLIDCGLIMVAENAKATMTRVAQDIAAACRQRIDVVVMTHEHWDHASGFSTQQAQAVFDGMDIGEVWYGWTEDPRNVLGNRLRTERADKVSALAQATTALAGMTANPIALARSRGLGAILGFFGLDMAAAAAAGNAIGKTRSAFEYLMKRRGVKTRYCYPDKPPLALDGVENVRVYVLGPPQDEAMIKKSAPSKTGREVYEMASESNLAGNLEAAFGRLGAAAGTSTDKFEDCPFDTSLHRRSHDCDNLNTRELNELMHETWDTPQDAWRKIGEDWTQVAETLALNLDTHTNNTCLVLAFEFTDTGEVFLFPADAQVGNWLSWQQQKWKIRDGSAITEVTGPELLGRTVFYKVGHHGSHNATLRSLGLELMTSDDLIAFIPVIREQAEKNRWMSMPFPPLVKRLMEKTGGRVLQSDDDTKPGKAGLTALPKEARDKFLGDLEIDQDRLFFEYSFR